jgi:hypothetical protein
MHSRNTGERRRPTFALTPAPDSEFDLRPLMSKSAFLSECSLASLKQTALGRAGLETFGDYNLDKASVSWYEWRHRRPSWNS